MANYEITEKNKITVGTQTREGSGQTIKPGLRADVMRKAMETKNTLKNKGSIYMGTGNKEIIKNTLVGSTEEVEVYETKALEPDAAGKVLTSNGTGSELSYEFLSDIMINTDGKNSKVFEKVASGGGISLQKTTTATSYTELNFTAPNSEASFIPSKIYINKRNSQTGASTSSTSSVTDYYFCSGEGNRTFTPGNIHGTLIGDISLGAKQSILTNQFTITNTIKPTPNGDFKSIWDNHTIDTNTLRIQAQEIFTDSRHFIPCFRRSYAAESGDAVFTYRTGLVPTRTLSFNNTTSRNIYGENSYLKGIAFRRNKLQDEDPTSSTKCFIDHPYVNYANLGLKPIYLQLNNEEKSRWFWLDNMSRQPDTTMESVAIYSFTHDTVCIPEIVSFSDKTNPALEDQNLYLVIFIISRDIDLTAAGNSNSYKTYAIATKLGTTIPVFSESGSDRLKYSLNFYTGNENDIRYTYNRWSFRTWCHRGVSYKISEYPVCEDVHVDGGSYKILNKILDAPMSDNIAPLNFAWALHNCKVLVVAKPDHEYNDGKQVPPGILTIDVDKIFNLCYTSGVDSSAYFAVPNVYKDKTLSDAYVSHRSVQIGYNGHSFVITFHDYNAVSTNRCLLSVYLVEK